MFDLVDVNLEKKIDDALHYLAENLRKSGHNTKPVLLHSFKLAMTLYLYNYSEDIILAGILHDLVEDTDLEIIDIEQKYGSKISKIVESVSFNPLIEDKLEQAKIMFENCLKCGYDALIVKCADLLDNINFVNLVDDESTKGLLLKKYRIFLEISKEKIGEEIIYILLNKKYETLCKLN